MFHHRNRIPRDKEREWDSASDQGRRHRPRSRSAFHAVLIGGLIVTFGLTLLANNLGWTDMRSVMRQFWPFALVIFGVANLFNDRPGATFWGFRRAR